MLTVGGRSNVFEVSLVKRFDLAGAGHLEVSMHN